MRVVRWGHSCVRLERPGAVLVIDPGIWSGPQAMTGADAVLLTHDHADHADVARLAAVTVPVFAPAGAHLPGVVFTPLHPEQVVDVVGFDVRAVGGEHARDLDAQPAGVNLGYLVDDEIYHPGDALHVPDRPVVTALVPVQASWLKTAEAVTYLHTVQPQRAIGIHDGQVNERGLTSINQWLSEYGRTDYRWVPPGTVL